MGKCWVFLMLLIGSVAATANDKIIRVNDVSDPNSKYAIDMLKLALSYSDKDYRIEIDSTDFTQGRANEEVRSGGLIDVMWTSSSRELEDELLPIRIPLFKGLLGYRIFIIKPDNQPKFDKIKTLEDLKKLEFGQGQTWGDTAILEANGFKVVKTSRYPVLFDMVEGGRFDAFPRGVHEPFNELAARPDMNLAIEKNLMLAYKMPFYFFVAKENTELARDIETGLNKAIADGSFDKAFMNSASVKDVFEKANMQNRQVFYIDNPTLTSQTPLDRKELWFSPEDLED